MAVLLPWKNFVVSSCKLNKADLFIYVHNLQPSARTSIREYFALHITISYHVFGWSLYSFVARECFCWRQRQCEQQ